MENDKIKELLNARALAEQQLEKMRSAVTILFSDIKGSTSYFEKKGDHAGLAMVQRHNELLTPIIVKCGGRVVKTIGDSIMACFPEPIGAVRAAIGMQQALERDRVEADREGRRRSEEEHIHIRIGLHTGRGLVKDNDVYGDVVNAAARVQRQAQPDQILITDALLEAANIAGAQTAKIGRAEMKGKEEPFDVYSVAWSASASEQLVDELQSQFDRKFKEAKRQQEQVEEEFEKAREEWRGERRRLNAEIEKLEESTEATRKNGKHFGSKDLQAELRFNLDEAIRARQQLEQAFEAERTKWESERNGLKAQISSMQGAALELMEQRNNPARFALAVREQLEARVEQAKESWQLEWEGERRRLNAEIDRLKNAGAGDEKKQAAKRALLQKMGKLPSSTDSGPKSLAQMEKEFEEARIAWDTERAQVMLRAERAERELQDTKDGIRNEVFHELRSHYEPKLQDAGRDRERLQKEVESLSAQINEERSRLTLRIGELEQAIPQAQDAARRQAVAEMKADLEAKAEELGRIRVRAERRFQDEAEEAESERRRLRKQIAQLEEQVKDAKEIAIKAQRSLGRGQE